MGKWGIPLFALPNSNMCPCPENLIAAKTILAGSRPNEMKLH